MTPKRHEHKAQLHVPNFMNESMIVFAEGSGNEKCDAHPLELFNNKVTGIFYKHELKL